MEVTMNELNYWFHNDSSKIIIKSIELKVTLENSNCNKCSKFQLLSTHVSLTFLASSILRCVLLALNYLKKPQ